MVGSTIGGYLPVMWGDSGLSMVALLFGLVGGAAGIWAGYKLANSFE